MEVKKKKKLSEEEAKKFPSCFKRSEYDVVEQKEKMPSKISSLYYLALKINYLLEVFDWSSHS